MNRNPEQQIKIKMFYQEISLLIGSSSNFAGDGPKTRVNSLELNGVKIVKTLLKYYVAEVRIAIFRKLFPHDSIQVGDEVIQLNNTYCEHIGNVSKYSETNNIYHIQIRNKTTGLLHNLNGNQANLFLMTYRRIETSKTLPTIVAPLQWESGEDLIVRAKQTINK